jgi:Protein  of unknown function (DUF3018)
VSLVVDLDTIADFVTESRNSNPLSDLPMLRLHVTEDINMTATPKPSRDKVRIHREKLRAQGLRPIQIWVPDVRSPEFAAEARRQSLLVSQSPHEAEEQAWVDAVSVPLWDDEE